jgi:hypothetical protein
MFTSSNNQKSILVKILRLPSLLLLLGFILRLLDLLVALQDLIGLFDVIFFVYPQVVRVHKVLHASPRRALEKLGLGLILGLDLGSGLGVGWHCGDDMA